MTSRSERIRSVVAAIFFLGVTLALFNFEIRLGNRSGGAPRDIQLGIALETLFCTIYFALRAIFVRERIRVLRLSRVLAFVLSLPLIFLNLFFAFVLLQSSYQSWNSRLLFGLVVLVSLTIPTIFLVRHALSTFQPRAEQIVGRERRGRVSHHDWSGDA
jgi:hypothetical protein